MDAAPKLRVISRRGVGVDSVDVAYAKSKGIEVMRTLNVVEPPVAELVLAYILEFSRRVSLLNRDMHNGKWHKRECHSVDGKVLGIVGMGRIAYEVAKRANAFGMSIIYADKIDNQRAETEFGAERVELNSLLERSDFVSIHMPLTSETQRLFDYGRIRKMKPGAYLINTARGSIIDEAGLFKAVAEGRIAGAAIDVFDVEPQENSILNSLENVLLTPHVGTFTREIFVKMDIEAAKNVAKCLTL